MKPGSPGAWLAGARLRTLPAAAGPVLAGGGLAWSDGGFAVTPFLAALAGALLIQVGTNFSNDYSDFVRGADTAERLGTPRVTQAGLLDPRAVRLGAVVSFALAVAAGVYLVSVGGWPIVWIGVAGILAGICYTGGPWPFGYHGLGDLFVLVFFGPVAVAGTYYVQLGRWAPAALLAGIGAGALATAILVVNNLRDRETDEAAGKRTLAVRIGRTATCAQYTFLLVVAVAIPPAGFLAGLWPAGALLASGAVLLTAAPLGAVWRHEDPRVLNPALAATARATGAYGLLFAAGCLW
ncbi:1,4-dihydroxy-2-naphthoate polyprenyltransferase [Candidatus Palauibacter sp.]|uniref:1,4-dihydroxy-2-naphthoate polyprenyltransferase n=1 Tax=Candidatus Palauibacter sp. TaxID=3101350 RepID=UPI003AF208F7